jgi:diguanylate cyclase (GGDEF)-like protein
MRFALPKNRTTPLIIFALFGMIVFLSIAVYHMKSLIMYSYELQYEKYDSYSDNAVILLQQEINNINESLQSATEYFATMERIDQEEAVELLTFAKAEHPYVDLFVTDEKGKGYDIAGERINVSDEDYFSIVRKGQIYISDKASYLQNTPVLIYAYPIMKDNVLKGALIAKVNGLIENMDILSEDIKSGSLIYLVNKNDELVAYIQGMEVTDFDLSSVISNGIFMNEYDSKNNKIFNSISEEDSNRDIYVWYKKPLGVNEWSVLYGHRYTIDKLTLNIYKLRRIMWTISILSTLFLFVLMITIQIRSNRTVIKTLYLDPVTGGGNWYQFRINVNKILNSKQFARKKYAIVNFDINRFKIINDAYGYQKGDEVLKDIFNVIKKWAKPEEVYTRYAADQFYILMCYDQEEELSARIYDLDDRLHKLRYTMSVKIYYGVYFIIECKDSIDRMGEFAQTAKNNIKGSAERIISFFDDAARGKLLEEEEIEKSMNDALMNHEFQVYLQPKCTTKEGEIAGAEALVRWKKENGKLISPGFFIPVFEKNGFITELDYYMLRKICELLRNWLDKGYQTPPISVNISRLHFANAHLADIIATIVDSYEVPHQLIEIELTESAFLQDKQTLICTVIQLREYGFLVSMDDFGAGYSSLNSLKDLPLDVVKLDGELFKLTEDVERGLTVIRNTIKMAKDLHIKVVAECIETKEQVEFLCNVGCDIIQGYYFAKPMPTVQFEQNYLSKAGID